VLAFSLWLRQPILLLHAALLDFVYEKKIHRSVDGG
jgi:hypothetical protein